MISRRDFLVQSAAVGLGATMIGKAGNLHAAEARTFTFGHDQPADTAYGFCAVEFDKKLAELSGGTMRVRHFPGGALGQEPEMAQKVRQGDIDFSINSTANTSTAVPQSGVFSLHFIFRDEAHLAKAVNDPAVNAAFKKMITDNVQGAFSLGLMTLGMRNMYAKFTISGLQDVIGDVASQSSLRGAVRTEPHGNPTERAHTAPPAYSVAKYIILLHGHATARHAVPGIRYFPY